MNGENEKKHILQAKLDQYVSKGAESVKTTLEKIQHRAGAIRDFLAPNSMVDFQLEQEAEGIMVNIGDKVHVKVHDHALGQFSEKYKVPRDYVKRKSHGEQWEKDLIVQVMNTELKNQPRDRLLLREYDGQVLGLLSDVYKRYNSAMLFMAFLASAKETESIVTAGYQDDTRDYIEIVKPKIIDVPTEKNGIISIALGAHLSHSDFGDGALALKTFMLQCRCLNGMVGQQILREVHIGKRIDTDITLSEKTVRLETELKVSLISDTMGQIFNNDGYEYHIQKIANASQTPIKNIEERVEQLNKVGITKDEQSALMSLLVNSSPDDGVDGEMTLWKFAQGISALARTPGIRKSVDLMEIAGNLIYN